MQVNRVIHHTVIHQHQTQTLAMVEPQGFGFGEFLAVE
jgi:hypothetical protein